VANHGKRFEQDFVASFKGLPDVSIDRFYDIMGFHKNVSNPSDYVAYQYPHQFYFECKSYEGGYIPLSALSHSQKTKLLAKSKIDGVIAGAVFNFRMEEPETYFVDIQALEVMRLNGQGGITPEIAKSIGIYVPHTLKRTRYKYDIPKLLGELNKQHGEIEND
jgi:penicillin-binding protein-related factor A (putative recombinase)